MLCSSCLVAAGRGIITATLTRGFWSLDDGVDSWVIALEGFYSETHDGFIQMVNGAITNVLVMHAF